MKTRSDLKNVAVIGALSDEKFVSKAAPLVNSRSIGRIYLFRKAGSPFGANEKIDVVRYRFLPRGLYDAVVFLHVLFLCIFRKIDLIVGVYFFPHGLYAGLAGILSGLPVIQLLTGTDLLQVSESPLFFRVLKRARFAGVRGENSKGKLFSMGIPSDKIFIQNNIFLFRDYEKLPSVEKDFDLVFVGYLRPLKRLDVLFAAMSILKREFASLKCLLVGDGPMRKELEQLAAKMGLADNVVFHGYSSDIRPLLSRAKVFVLTSQSEGLPMAVVEAMACGIPVVAPAINDIPSVVKDGESGFLVRDADGEKVAEACRRLLADEGFRRRMGQSGRECIRRRAESDFSPAVVERTWADIMEQSCP